MARLWSTGFELQSAVAEMEFDGVNGGGQSIDTSIKRSGGASYKIITSDGESRYIDHEYSDGNVVTFLRFYIYFASFPTDATGALATIVNDVWDECGSIAITTAGKLQLYDGGIGGTQRGSDSSALSTGVWYRVELKVENGGSPELEAKIDGAVFASGDMTVATNAENLYLGMIDWVAGCVLYIDDVAVNSNAGSYQNSYPGEGKIVHVHPNAAGDNAATAGLYSAIDEVTPNEDTDYIELDTNGKQADYNLQSSSDVGIGASDTISVIQVGSRDRADSTGSQTFKLRIKSQASGTVLEGSDVVHNDQNYRTLSDLYPRVYTLTSYVDPQAAGAWTPALLDTAQIGVEAVDATPDVWVTTLWALVEYVEGEEVTGPAGVKTINETAIASVKTIQGLAIASVKTINESSA